MNGLPNILVLSNTFDITYEPLTTANDAEGFSRSFNLHFLKNEFLVHQLLAKKNIDLIIVNKLDHDHIDLNDEYSHKVLYVNPIELIHLLDGDWLFKMHIETMLKPRSKPNELMSVFTCSHNIGDMIYDTYYSLTNQDYHNWEWVVVDDGSTDDTFEILSNISKADYRVKVFKEARKSGVIGYLKNRAASLCSGNILVELDHDDQLTYDALKVIKDAFDKNPSASYLYSDSVEYYPDGSSRTYGEGFGMGCGTYYDFEYNYDLYVACAVPLNSKTLRHNVGLPNHVRAWRADFYKSIGGHNKNLCIADDHELSIRSWLHTDVIHVNSVLYFQRVREGGQNTTNTRNAEIQRTSRGIINYYDEQIHNRILELERVDHCWNDINKTSDLSKAIDTEEDYSIKYIP